VIRAGSDDLGLVSGVTAAVVGSRAMEHLDAWRRLELVPATSELAPTKCSS